jgi:hypothetical protein
MVKILLINLLLLLAFGKAFSVTQFEGKMVAVNKLSGDPGQDPGQDPSQGPSSDPYSAPGKDPVPEPRTGDPGQGDPGQDDDWDI